MNTGLSTQSAWYGSVIITNLYLRKKLGKTTTFIQMMGFFQHTKYKIDEDVLLSVIAFLKTHKFITEDNEKYFDLKGDWYNKINIDCGNPRITIVP